MSVQKKDIQSYLPMTTLNMLTRSNQQALFDQVTFDNYAWSAESILANGKMFVNGELFIPKGDVKWRNYDGKRGAYVTQMASVAITFEEVQKLHESEMTKKWGWLCDDSTDIEVPLEVN